MEGRCDKNQGWLRKGFKIEQICSKNQACLGKNWR